MITEPAGDADGRCFRYVEGRGERKRTPERVNFRSVNFLWPATHGKRRRRRRRRNDEIEDLKKIVDAGNKFAVTRTCGLHRTSR